jgi:Zn-dependent protease
MNINEILLQKVLIIPAILIAFTFHEYAHAIVAVKLGDDTPKNQGRLTLNPFSHIDIIGFIMILIFRFGWAKPVQTNPSAFKNLYKDDLKVSLAGPLANVIVGFISTVILIFFERLPMSNENLQTIILIILYLTATLNCMWFFLNLIPVPGFDGFHIIMDLFPKTLYKLSDALYRYQMIIFLILIIPIIGNRSILEYIIGVPGNKLFDLFYKAISSLF